MEWTGKWNDEDSRWTPALRQELSYFASGNDGLFWMEFSDFKKHFDGIDAIMIKHKTNGAPWYESRKRITFRMDPAMMPGWAAQVDPTSGRTFYVNATTAQTQWNFPLALPAGWVAHDDPATGKLFYVDEKTGQSSWNAPAASSSDLAVEAPIYVMVLPQAVDEAYFSVHQRDIRCVDAVPYVDFGVTVMHYNAESASYDLITSTGNSADRQNQTEGMSLEAGQYLVIPTSTGVVLKNRAVKECLATLVVHTSGPHSLLEQPFHPTVYEEAIGTTDTAH